MKLEKGGLTIVVEGSKWMSGTDITGRRLTDVEQIYNRYIVVWERLFKCFSLFYELETRYGFL